MSDPLRREVRRIRNLIELQEKHLSGLENINENQAESIYKDLDSFSYQRERLMERIRRNLDKILEIDEKLEILLDGIEQEDYIQVSSKLNEVEIMRERINFQLLRAVRNRLEGNIREKFLRF